MRTYLFILIFTFFIFGCNKKDKTNKTIDNNLHETIIDENNSNDKILNQNVQYLGFIESFFNSNKNEVYIELYFNKDDTNNNEYDNIVKLADSLIYSDNEYSRHKFPKQLSQKYFDLRGLSKLKVFDKTNQFYCNATLTRVEYLNQNISSPFIGVFTTDKVIEEVGYYGISNTTKPIEQANFITKKDTILTKKILSKLKEKSPYLGLENINNHLYISKNDSILSVLNSEKFYYITLTTNKEFKVLYKSLDEENVIDIQFIPRNKNKFPHILTRNGQPETDVMWNNLLFFDGTKYVAKDRQRIE